MISGARAEPAAGVGEVELDRGFRDPQAVRDLGRAVTLGDEGEAVALARSEGRPGRHCTFPCGVVP